MWHKVTEVMKQYRLDPVIANKVVASHRDKFSIVNEHGFDEINTWHTNDFVAEVKNQMKQRWI